MAVSAAGWDRVAVVGADDPTADTTAARRLVPQMITWARDGEFVTDRWIKAQSLNTNYTHPLSILGQMV